MSLDLRRCSETEEGPEGGPEGGERRSNLIWLLTVGALMVFSQKSTGST